MDGVLEPQSLHSSIIGLRIEGKRAEMADLTHAGLTMATYLNLEFSVSQRCSIFFVLCLLLFFLQCYGYETGEGLHAKKYMFILSWFLCVL